MNPVQAITTCLRTLFQFPGRAPRAEFWWFVAFAMAALALLPAVILNQRPLLTLEIVVSLALLPALFAVGLRRFRDAGQPAWHFPCAMLLALVLRPFAYDMTTPYQQMTSPGLGIFAVSWAIYLWLFWGSIIPSTSGPTPLEVTP